MRIFVSVIALAIVMSATVSIATNSVEARERGKSTKDQLTELRQRLHYYYQYSEKQQTAAPATAPTTAPNKTASHSPTPTAEATAPVTDQYLETVRAEIHRLTNLERSKAGVANLAHDTALAAVAESHSEDMLTRDYFSHTSPDGCNMGCRLDKADYDYSYWGENIAWRKSSTLPDAKALAKHFVDSWMNSSGHRKNILSGNFTNEGIGLAREGGLVYATASFSNPR